VIVTVTPNPALDITYRVERLVPGTSHRVEDVTERAGGKGVNVARTLRCLGYAVLATGPVGGPAAAAFVADLAAVGIDTAFVPSPEPTRRSVAIVAGSQATLFNEAGHAVPESVWVDLEAVVSSRCGRGDVVVVSGSMPTGAPVDLVARLTGAAGTAGAMMVLDVRGEPLARSLPLRPAVVAPNAEEAHETTGLADPVSAGRALVAAGAGCAVISRSAAGLVAVPPAGPALCARLPKPLAGNPTGAGDALKAALAARLDGLPAVPDDPVWWSDTLRAAVAWSGAVVLQPVAGVADPTDVARLAAEVVVGPCP
jgi:1-phosphofructokinase family hexose kinase